MSRLLQVAQLGHRILRGVAKPISVFDDRALQELIDDMVGTGLESQSVGIAAPQVYQPVRLIVVASKPIPAYPDAPFMEPTPMLNPSWVSNSKDMELGWEGCLSIPGIRAKVSRFQSIIVKYHDRHGCLVEAVFEGFLARIIQHESDHLDGVVFTDRADSKTFITNKEYQKIL